MLYFLPSRTNSSLASPYACIGLPLAAANLTVFGCLCSCNGLLSDWPHALGSSRIDSDLPATSLTSSSLSTKFVASTRTRRFVRLLQSSACLSIRLLNEPVVAIIAHFTEPVTSIFTNFDSTHRADLHEFYCIDHEQLHESHIIHHADPCLPRTWIGTPRCQWLLFFSFTNNMCPEL